MCVCVYVWMHDNDTTVRVQPSILRLTATTLERVDHNGLVAWSTPYRLISRIELVSKMDGSVPMRSAFAVVTVTGERPRVFATDEWGEFESSLKRLASKGAGVNVPVHANDATSRRQASQLLDAWEQSKLKLGSSGATEPQAHILGQWEVNRIKATPGMYVGGVHLRPARLRQMTNTVTSITQAGEKRFGRTLTLYQHHFVERRGDSFKVLNVRTLTNVAAVVRSEEEAQVVSFEFDNGEPSLTYALTQRDELIASVIGAVEAVRGHAIPVLPVPTGCGEQIVRDASLENEEYHLEPLYVKVISAGARDLTTALTASLAGKTAHLAVATFVAIMREFNATLPYAGLSMGAQIPETLLPALLALLPSPHNPKANKPPPAPSTSAAIQYTTVLQTLRRLTGATAGTSVLVSTPGSVRKIFAALDSGNDVVSVEATRLLAAICRGERGPSSHEGLLGQLAGHLATAVQIAGQNIQRAGGGGGGGHSGGDGSAGDLNAPAGIARSDAKALAEENMIRNAKVELLAGSNRIGHIMNKLKNRDVSQLMSLAISDLIEGLACQPHRKTTEEVLFHEVLKHSVAIGRPLFNLFQHRALRVRDTASKLMRVISEHGAEAATPMREAALKEGAVVVHLDQALFSEVASSRKLSRELVALWTDDYGPALELLARIFPRGIMEVLKQETGAKLKRVGAGYASSGTIVGFPVAPTTSLSSAAAQSSLSSGPGTAYGTGTGAAMSNAGGGGGVGVGGGGGAAQSLPPMAPAIAVATATEASHAGHGHGHGHGHHKKIDWIENKLKLNWSGFWKEIAKNHNECTVIWNENTRQELRSELETAIELLQNTRRALGEAAASQDFTWNYKEFAVTYSSLQGFIVENGIYVNVFLDAVASGRDMKIEQPAALYHSLWMRFLTGGDMEVVPFLKQIEASSVHRGVYGDTAQREMCLRAMTALYKLHAKQIGRVTGIGHLVWLLDCTMEHRMRHIILKLLEELVVVPSNAVALVEHGSVEVLVDLACAAHTDSAMWVGERECGGGDDAGRGGTDSSRGTDAAGDDTNGAGTSTDASSASSLREWYCQGDNEGDVLGPISRAQIAKAFARGKVDFTTKFRAEGMSSWKPFCEIRQLRWLVAAPSKIMRPIEVALSAVKILRQLVSLQTPDELVVPFPRVHRELTSDRCLPHVIQLLLLDGPQVVSEVASLLESVVVFNKDVKERLYMRGLYFFALAYGGSNLDSIASLLAKTHRQQQTLYDTHTKGSVLSGMLPESLMYMLDTYGPARFATAFIADVQSPELIWTHAMRQEVLIPHVRQHICDFAARLSQNFHLVYDYCPIPPIKFKQLEGEMWCHRYYLRHFCDTKHFPETDVRDHIEFLQSLLGTWREEMMRSPVEEMSLEQAKVTLGLEKLAEVADDDVRRAYRRLAIKFHPDKNPAGKERFIEVQKAYDRMLAGHMDQDGGPQLWRLELLLQAQCIIYRRYPEVLGEYKYGGFAMVLETFKMASGRDAAFLSKPDAKLVVLASELCWLSCVSSSSNGDELIRSGAIGILSDVLTFCVSKLSRDASSDDTVTKIVLFLLRLFCGLSTMDRGARELAENHEGTLWDVMYCCTLTNATKCLHSAVNCVSQMASNALLQTALVDMGAIFVLTPLIFAFDVTLDDAPAARDARSDSAVQRELSSPETDPSKDAHLQRELNYLAMMAVRSIGRLAGVLGDKFKTEENDDMVACLYAFFTPDLAQRISEIDPRDLLRAIHSVTESAHLIWNESMREELRTFISSELDLGSRPRAFGSMRAAKQFRYKFTEKELMLGEVYVRVFNEDPTAPLKDQSAFTKTLLEYCKRFARRHLQPSTESAASGDGSISVLDAPGMQPAVSAGADFIAVVDALQNLVSVSPKLSSFFAEDEYLSVFLSMILPSMSPTDGGGGEEDGGSGTTSEDGYSKLQRMKSVTGLESHVLCQKVLKLMNSVLSHASCHDFLSTDDVASTVMRVAFNPEPKDASVTRTEALEFISALAHTDGFALAGARHAGAIYLISLVVPDDSSKRVHEVPVSRENRLMAARILERLSLQKTHGLQVLYIARQLFQEGFVSLLHRGDDGNFVTALDEDSCTPERIWNAQIKNELAACVEGIASKAFDRQMSAGGCDWFSIPEDFCFEAEEIKAHPEFGGVYLDLYLKDPRFPLSYPRKFLEAMMKRFTEIVTSSPEAIDAQEKELALQLSSAMINLFIAQPQMIDHGVTLGYMTSLVGVVAGDGVAPADERATELRGGSLRIIHQMVNSPAGAQALATCSKPYAVTTLMFAMDWNLAAGILALETLKRALGIGNRSRDILVAQSISGGLLQKLIDVLSWNTTGGDGGETDASSSSAAATNGEADAAAATTSTSGASAAAGFDHSLIVLDAAATEKGTKRVLCIEVLKLLALEGTRYGPQIQERLSSIDAWSYYRDQKLDLFLPKGSSTSSTGVVGALAGGELQKYALPAPADASSSAES